MYLDSNFWSRYFVCWFTLTQPRSRLKVVVICQSFWWQNKIPTAQCNLHRMCTLLVDWGTHTHTQPFNSCWSGITRVGQYQEKHLPTHTHPGHRTSFISFFHLLRSIASLCSVYVLDSPLWQPLSRSSLVFLLVLGPLLHTPCIFFTQSSSSLCSTCPYYHSLFCCNTSAMPSIPSLSVSSLLGNLLVDWGKSE